MGFKQAAEELLKIADEIEKDASEITQFVCGSCNHTATLAKINGMRKEAAQSEGVEVVADVTVNDQIHCPACDGVMAYQETEASAPYYFDPDKKATDEVPPHDESKETPADEAKETPETQKAEKEQGTEKHPAPEGAAKTAKRIDYDSLRRYASK